MKWMFRQRGRREPMLDPYIGESMLSIIDINYGIKEPTHGIQYCIPGQIWIFDGYLKAR